jgi:hypothetical protein
VALLRIAANVAGLGNDDGEPEFAKALHALGPFVDRELACGALHVLLGFVAGLLHRLDSLPDDGERTGEPVGHGGVLGLHFFAGERCSHDAGGALVHGFLALVIVAPAERAADQRLDGVGLLVHGADVELAADLKLGQLREKRRDGPIPIGLVGTVALAHLTAFR